MTLTGFIWKIERALKQAECSKCSMYDSENHRCPIWYGITVELWQNCRYYNHSKLENVRKWWEDDES